MGKIVKGLSEDAPNKRIGHDGDTECLGEAGRPNNINEGISL